MTVYSLYYDPQNGGDHEFLYLAYSHYNDAFAAKTKLEEVYGVGRIFIDNYDNSSNHGYENVHCQGYDGD